MERCPHCRNVRHKWIRHCRLELLPKSRHWQLDHTTRMDSRHILIWASTNYDANGSFCCGGSSATPVVVQHGAVVPLLPAHNDWIEHCVNKGCRWRRRSSDAAFCRGQLLWAVDRSGDRQHRNRRVPIDKCLGFDHAAHNPRRSPAIRRHCCTKSMGSSIGHKETLHCLLHDSTRLPVNDARNSLLDVVLQATASSFSCR
mmetsp:Transcript_58525/g.67595  ORF Transcript_58525/g.67595 Transcript_58525/m.67595 type:complete len:200 (-) Transcript_58525:49-648(-)